MRQRYMRRSFSLLLTAVLFVPPAWPDIGHRPPLAQLLKAAGMLPQDAMPDATRLANSPTRAQQLPLFRAVMARPLEAPHRAAMLARSYAQAAASEHDLVSLTGTVAGLRASRSAEAALGPLEAALRDADDPLAASLDWMTPMTAPGSRWPLALPGRSPSTDPLRFELALVLSAMADSHRFLARAFAEIPATATPRLLRRQALEGDFQGSEEPDFRQLLVTIDRDALLAGMLTLVAAVERLQRFVITAPQPPVSWTLDTPMGQIAVDTTGAGNRYLLLDPLLVLDVGGDDEYRFLPRSDGHRISVLLDHGGNDRYEAIGPGSDPSSATLGLGILWDTEGDDHHLGTRQAQASALFGAALLVDGGGDNHFVAGGHAQAHAIAGLAILHASPGKDRFTAQTHAQGSAGPLGVAVLIDPSGDDRYTLDNTPLSRPSSQLPGHNSSMGQGAGRGLRGDARSGRSAAGGIGILIDLAGDDRYLAQVFAQGVGYHEGLGLLVDNGGDNRFAAAWYAMGAAAHDAAGLLLKRGTGNDSYRSSHSISLGAAHDFSVGIFLDAGGDDAYAAADLSLGAAHDNSLGLFIDAAGDDAYRLAGAGCRAFGAADRDPQGSGREDRVNLGLFMDLGGADRYPAHCSQARNDAVWTSPQASPARRLRSEAGAGIDGDWPSPFDAAPDLQQAWSGKMRD